MILLPTLAFTALFGYAAWLFRPGAYLGDRVLFCIYLCGIVSMWAIDALFWLRGIP
jgi:hypothetical protein